MIPVSIRRWFLAHFAFNVLVGAPLLLIPRTFLGGLGWITIDPASARFCGAALVAVGVQSLLTFNEGHHALRTMLNFKMVWSWAAIAGLVFSAAEGAPNPVWAVLAIYVAMSGLWFHLRVKLAEYLEHGAPMSDEIPIFPLSPQLQATATPNDVDEVSDQFFVDDLVPSKPAPLPRVVLKPKDPSIDLLGDAPIDDRSAGSLLGRFKKPGAAASKAESQADEADDKAFNEAAKEDDPEALGADDIAAMFARGGDAPAEKPTVDEDEAPTDSAGEPEVAEADAEPIAAPGEEAIADETADPPPAETNEASEEAAIANEPAALETSEPAALEATEPAALETNEPVAIETSEPVAIETSEPVAIEASEPVAIEASEPVIDISEASEPDAPIEPAVPPADEMAPEVVVAAAGEEAIIDDALAAAEPLAPVESNEPTPGTILADEITKETSVEQIEQSVALEDNADGAAGTSSAGPVLPPAPPVAAAAEIRKAIDSVLRPKTGKQAPTPTPTPTAKTLNGLPVLRLEEETAAANVEPADTTDDEELGMDAIAAMLAANRG